MRSLSYVTKGVPTCFADCIDYVKSHVLQEVSLGLTSEDEFGETFLIEKLIAEFRWVFDDREVVYRESMGGIVEHEDEERHKRSIFNANRRLDRRKRDFAAFGIELRNAGALFRYGEAAPRREDFSPVLLERLTQSMRVFYRTFPRYRFSGWKILFLLVGLALFLLVLLLPEWRDAVDPAGAGVSLSRQGKAAMGLFLLAMVWWISEAAPVAVITLSIGLLQPLFGIRSSAAAFGDFLDPAVIFIFGAVVLGLALSKTGLSRRLAYRMLSVVGEQTRWILLGAFLLTAALSHVMAHTAAAAALFPVLAVLCALYEGRRDNQAPSGSSTRFGKALFIGMAYSAGAGSVVTFLGSARAAAAADMFGKLTGGRIEFLQLSKYLLPVGWVMVPLIWIVLWAVFRPEKRRIHGLREKVRRRLQKMGRLSAAERGAAGVLAGVVLFMVLQSLVPALRVLDRSAVMLIAVLLLFLLRILTTKDLSDVPWNIILLVSGAMSLGYCLYETGAAQWIALQWLSLFRFSGWLTFSLSVALLVLALTNVIMNVAAMTISLPVSLAIAGYAGINPEVVLFASLVVAGMPFLLIIGAPPNAIAYGAKQFRAGTFFLAGLPLSILLIALLTFALAVLWPAMGMAP